MARHANGWSLLASYSWDRRDPRNINPRNPNEAAYRAQSTGGVITADFPPELVQTYQGVRFSGTYELPWKILAASTFTGQQGEYFPRIDEGSSNGIYVNGARVTEALLRPGDEVSIGNTRFRFEV